LKKILLCLLVLLSGCVTREYLQAQDECTPSAYRQFPPRTIQMYVPRTTTVSVPTGGSKCESRTDDNRVKTKCTPEMRTEYRTYQSLEVIDTNAEPRDAVMRSCVRDLCVQRFGNSDCKAPGS
jgi:hypothetical protein